MDSISLNHFTKPRFGISYWLSTTKSNDIQMAVEGAICSFSVEGLETYSLMIFGALAVGLFSVFGGKFFKKSEDVEDIQVPSLT